jgi:hypothetical protein
MHLAAVGEEAAAVEVVGAAPLQGRRVPPAGPEPQALLPAQPEEAEVPGADRVVRALVPEAVLAALAARAGPGALPLVAFLETLKEAA